MSTLNDLGYKLQPSAPNAQGLCTFAIIDAHGAEVATIDRACTLDEAFAAAREFVESELEKYLSD